MAGRRWAGTTFGNGWMHNALISVLRVVPVCVLYLFADILVVPVCIVLNDSRKTAWRFYRDILGYGCLRAAAATYRNHCLFAQVVIDRFAMYAGKRFKVQVEGADIYQALAGRSEGFLQLSSHIGNYEIAGYSLVSERKVINAVVYAFEKESVMANRDSMFSKTNIRMIALREDMSHLFEIDAALSGGDIVSFPTDRFLDGAKVVERDFFGRKAKFPQGPFSVAAMRGADVVAVNTMKEGLRRYRMYVTPLSYDKEAPRRAQVRQLSEAYVAELEKRVRQYPTQWYNFFDFWA